jgi:hypothetical protein
MNHNDLALFLLSSLVFPAYSMHFPNQSPQDRAIIDESGKSNQLGQGNLNHLLNFRAQDGPAEVAQIAERIIAIARMPDQEFLNNLDAIDKEIASMDLTGIAQPVLDTIQKALGGLKATSIGIVNNTYDALNPQAQAAFKPLLTELVNRYRNEPGAEQVIIGLLENRIK